MKNFVSNFSLIILLLFANQFINACWGQVAIGKYVGNYNNDVKSKKSKYTAITPKHRIFYSPNKKYYAIIFTYYYKTTRSSESEIEIHSTKHGILVSGNYISKDHEHGMKIMNVQWTKDSKYFVFNGVIQGGHQPGHFPTYFFNSNDHKIYSLDSFVGIWVTNNFKIDSVDNISIMTRDRVLDGSYKDSLIKTVNLNNLIKRK